MIADEIHAGDLLRVLPDIMEISDTEATPKKKRKEKKLMKLNISTVEETKAEWEKYLKMMNLNLKQESKISYVILVYHLLFCSDRFDQSFHRGNQGLIF